MSNAATGSAGRLLLVVDQPPAGEVLAGLGAVSAEVVMRGAAHAAEALAEARGADTPFHVAILLVPPALCQGLDAEIAADGALQIVMGEGPAPAHWPADRAFSPRTAGAALDPAFLSALLLKRASEAKVASAAMDYEILNRAYAMVNGEFQRQNRRLQTQEAELVRQATLLETALNTMHQGLLVLESDQTVALSNARLLNIMGYDPETVKQGAPLRDLIKASCALGHYGAKNEPQVRDIWRRRLSSRIETSHQLSLPDGRIVSGSCMPAEDGRWVVTFEDVTWRINAERALARQNERMDAALENMPDGLCMFDSDMRLILCNNAYQAMYGLPEDLVATGTPLSRLMDHRKIAGSAPTDLENYHGIIAAAIASETQSRARVELQDGRVIEVSFNPIRGRGGVVATHQDITDALALDAKIRHMASHDALTGIPNRVGLRDAVEAALYNRRADDLAAVLCLDLDHFKSVNDTLGHPVGDQLLVAVTRRLREELSEGDVMGRLGGDEFVVLLSNAESPAAVGEVAQRLISVISEPFDIEGHQVVVGCSIGIALAPTDGATMDALLKSADMALYRPKSDGRGTYRFFELHMDARLQERRRLELDLRRAIAADEFVLYYQPLVDAQTEEITGFEALLRWNHPERGIVSPGEFVPLAEEIGLIVPIGNWVIRRACMDAVTWPRPVKVAVNLSPAQFKSQTLALTVLAALGESSLPPSRLELEITESVLLSENDSTLQTLHDLRRLGVRISMDDFGTGYSSLSYLRSFPFDKIKIDRSFVSELGSCSDSVAIVRAVAGLGMSLGMATTAEGVETQDQLDRVREQGCTEVQGYFFSPPRPQSEIAGLFAARDEAAPRRRRAAGR